MRKPIFTGAAPAIVTPFTDTGVNYPALAELIEFVIAGGVDALVVCGTTGEASTMPDDEHIDVIKFAVDQVKGRVPVIAGTGSNDTKHGVELSKEAEAVGADALLHVTPYYNKATQKGLYQHFAMMAKSVSIPLVLYNVPGRTSVNMNPETVKALSEIENIVAVKECNLAQVGDIVNLCGDDFSVYSGDDNVILPVLALGGKGVISVMANIIPQDTHDMVMKFFQGDVQGAVQLQLRTLNLIKAIFCEVNPIPIKAAVNLMGFAAGQCRLPLTEIEAKSLELLRAEMKIYGLL